MGDQCQILQQYDMMHINLTFCGLVNFKTFNRYEYMFFAVLF